jgi:hypothetical protein
MISKDEICKVIQPDYVEEGDGSFHFHESDPQPRGLKDVDFHNSGHYLVMSSQVLKATKNLYVKKCKEVYLQNDCDKVVLFEKEGKKYLFWIEVKTSLAQVYRAAIYQFPGCYYRIKTLLDIFASYTDDDVIECAVAIYADDAPPAEQNSSEKSEEYVRVKYTKISPEPESKRQKIEHKYAKLLLPQQKGLLEGVDFGTDQLPIMEKYKVNSLPCVIWPVSYEGAAVNLDEIIALL